MGPWPPWRLFIISRKTWNKNFIQFEEKRVKGRSKEFDPG